MTHFGPLVQNSCQTVQIYNCHKVKHIVGPNPLAVVRPTGVYLLDFFCSGIQFYLLLNPYLIFTTFLYIIIALSPFDFLIYMF